MAKYFQVTNALGGANAKLDSQGRASVQYTAKNVSAAPIDGRAILVSLPVTKPPSGVVEKGWVKLDGSAERKFEKDQEQVFAVRIAAPPKTPAGNYVFRLDVVSVATPDVGDTGPTVSFGVAELPDNGGGSKWLLIFLVVMLVLAVIGLGTWLMLRKPGGTTTQTPTPTPTQPTPTQPTPTQPAPQTPARPTPRPNPLPYGPDTCKQGFVWREAVPTDHVCVTPQVRAQTAADNQLRAARRSPVGGPYGPDTCLQGYVWRDAFANDHVCVTGQTRSQAAADNAQAASRKVQP